MTTLALMAIAFAAGSIPFGVFVARRHGVDIQARGSGNIGATNVGRVLGFRVGLLVLILDALKGALPVLLAIEWRGMTDVPALVGAAAIIGHCFSPWLGGKGGKGVATALGVFAMLMPWLTFVGAGVAAAAYAWTRVAAIASLAGMFTIAVLAVVRVGGPCALLAVATAVLLVYTHRGNLARLLAR
jgi:glycerol-3-phosphate acyltransferase PlsY